MTGNSCRLDSVLRKIGNLNGEFLFRESVYLELAQKVGKKLEKY